MFHIAADDLFSSIKWVNDVLRAITCFRVLNKLPDFDVSDVMTKNTSIGDDLVDKRIHQTKITARRKSNCTSSARDQFVFFVYKHSRALIMKTPNLVQRTSFR